jgi:hypothetical protein
MPAPTASRTAPQSAGQTAPSGAPVAVIPFTRASRKKTRNIGTYGPVTLNTSVQAQPVIALPAAGYLRAVWLTVTAVTAGNAATVAFNADAPFNILQQISLTAANGDSIISTIDGFSLYALNKYGCFGTGTVDPVREPSYSITTGAGATGGSFQFVIRIPVELDSRDGLGALQNMAANQSFLLQYSLNNIASVYTTAPTAAAQITVNATMEYWNAPAPTNLDGVPQAQAPNGNGTVSLIQTQQPPLVPSSTQNIQLLNVGNTIRSCIFILRTAAGVRTETDWPTVTNFYVNNDSLMYKRKEQWRAQLATDYGLWNGITAAPTANALDNGVFVLDDFINDGAQGGRNANAASNRNLWLVTNSATAFNIEAGTAWGATASSLLVIQNNVRPASPQSLYSGQFI